MKTRAVKNEHNIITKLLVGYPDRREKFFQITPYGGMKKGNKAKPKMMSHIKAQFDMGDIKFTHRKHVPKLAN